MSTVDTSTWNPDYDFNESIEGIPLSADANIAQTWQAIRILMAAFKGDTSAIQSLMVPFAGATSQADGTQGFVPAPEAGDEDKVLKGDGTWASLSSTDIPSLDASKITSGTIDIARLPAGALERLVTVADQTARYALTIADVQLGDTVKEADTGLLYFVVDTSKLNSADGYEVYTTGAAMSVPWSGVTGKPSSFTPSSHTHGNITNDGQLDTASRALITGSGKYITVSSVTAAELAYLSGVTSAVQTQINGKVSKSGDTMTGNLTIAKNAPTLFTKNTAMTRGTAPSASVTAMEILGLDNAAKRTWGLYHQYGTDKSQLIRLICYNGTVADDDSFSGIGVGYTASGNLYTIAPTPSSTTDNSTKIATTEWVRTATGNFACNAATASKLANARSISLSGVVSGSANFDGSANIDISTSRRSCLVGESGTDLSKPWFKVASIAITTSNTDRDIVFLVEDTYVSNNYGVLRAHVRVDGNKNVQENQSVLQWMVTTGFNVAEFVLVLPTTSSPTVEIWTKVNYSYMGRRFTVLSEGHRGGSDTFFWTLYDTGLTEGQSASITTAGTQKISEFVGRVNYAATAASATKATQDVNGLQIDTGYLKKTGGTMTGDLSLDNKSLYRLCSYARSTAPASDQSGWLCAIKDSNSRMVAGIHHVYYTDKSARMRLLCYRGTTTDNVWTALEVGYDASGNIFTSAHTPDLYDNSNNIATTAFVYRNAARHSTADLTFYVSNAGVSGEGTSVNDPMPVWKLWLVLATLHMHPTVGSADNSRSVTIRFVRTGTSYGTVRIDAAKMPGVRYLTVTNATGTDSTTSNWSTNSPEFSNFLVNGSGLQVTLRNVYVSGTVWAEYHGRLTIDTFVGAGRFVVHNYSRIDFADNTVVNVHNIGTDYFATSYEFGYLRIAGNTVTFNFREQCYFSAAIFRTDGCGRLYVDYTRLKFTGTQPVVAISVSGTKTGHSSTAAGTAAKVVTLESGQTFSLVTNAVAYVTFDDTNTAANPTLNINNTGAKAIWLNGAAIPAKYLNKYIQYKFTYDGTRYICNNTFQRVEVAAQNSLFQTTGNYDQTYNSGSWNWNGFINWYGTGAVANGVVSGNVTGTSANVTGTVVIGHGGTGATTREDACKNLFQKDIGTSAVHFLTGLGSFTDSGYSTVADVKTILGLKSAAYTESSAYAASGHTHSYLPLSGGTLTGDTFITKDNPKILLRNSKIVKGVTELESNNFNRGFSFRDANNVEFGAIEHGFLTDKTNRLNLIVYKGTSTVTNDGNCKISVGFDKDGNWFTEAPTPGVNDNSTKIATTAWVRTHVANSGSSSDERLKTPLSAVPDEVLDAWGAVKLGQFKFLEAVEEKGEKARLHLGLVAQQVLRVFNEHGLDACRYGILCHETSVLEQDSFDEWTVRYTEALCIEAMHQRRRADRLEARIAALEEAMNG